MRNVIHSFKDWKAAMQNFYNNDQDPGLEMYQVVRTYLSLLIKAFNYTLIKITAEKYNCIMR